jgi:hypothetical protein
MKIAVTKLDPAEVQGTHPIADRVPGWYFQIREQSMLVWCVEGTDLWGRKVGATGHGPEPDHVLARCVNAAEDINAQLAARGG